MHALIAKSSFVNPKYSLYYLSQAIQKFKVEHRGTTIKGVTQRKLKDLPFPLPPLSEQKYIVKYIESILSDVEEIKKIHSSIEEEINQINSSILDRAF